MKYQRGKCKLTDKSYSYIASHFIIQHVPTLAVPFYCSPCHFKFHCLFAFKSHQKQKRHIMTVRSKTMDPKKMLITSKTPYKITDDDIC